MVSPFRLITRCSTPWVAGCCGPIFTTISFCGVMPTSLSILKFNHINRIFVIFAKRVAFPLIGQDQVAQIGMAQEVYPKELEHFALVKLGRLPDAAYGLYFRMR